MVTYSNVVIPKLSDAELIDRKINYTDPLDVPLLTEGHPPLDQHLVYQGKYQVAKLIRCAFGHPHKKGYVFRSDDGRHFLIGHVCGRTHLGMGTWDDFELGREEMEVRIYYLRTLRELDTVFRNNRDWIASLIDHRMTGWLDAAQSSLASFPRLYKAVRDVVNRSDSMLSVTVNVRDFAAEERAREIAAQEGQPLAKRPTITKRVEQNIGPLQGAAIFSNKSSYQSELAKIVKYIDSFLMRDKSGDRDLRTTTTNARDLLTSVLNLRDAVSEVRAFFAPVNLDRFCRWANDRRFDSNQYIANANRLQITTSSGRILTELIPPVEDYDADHFNRLAAHTTAWSERIAKIAKQRAPRKRI